MKKHTKRNLIAFIISAAAFMLLFTGYDGFESSGSELYRILCDCTFAVGTVYLCIGLLIWAGNLGIFDMLGYGIGAFIGLFKKDIKDVRYANYMEYKEARKSTRIAWIFLAVIGLVYIIIAFIFLHYYTAAA